MRSIVNWVCKSSLCVAAQTRCISTNESSSFSVSLPPNTAVVLSEPSESQAYLGGKGNTPVVVALACYRVLDDFHPAQQFVCEGCLMRDLFRN
jgi:hypothetical protein